MLPWIAMDVPADVTSVPGVVNVEEEGMMELNSALELPPLPRRLAVISAGTAAGYGDFMEH